MTDVDTITTYLTKNSQVRDELGAAGEKVEDIELVRYALNGFTAKWHTFVQRVSFREKLPYWTRLWDDFVHEETREGTFQNTTQSSEEDVALLTKGKGKRGKKREKDLSKVRCYNCNKLGHYASQCPKKNDEDKEGAASTEVQEHAAQFEKEISFA